MQRTDLEAINPESNVHRFYTVMIETNLFQEYTVTTSYGRIGHRGQTKSYLFETHAEAQKKYEQIIKKRLNASKRIGTNYHVLT